MSTKQKIDARIDPIQQLILASDNPLQTVMDMCILSVGSLKEFTDRESTEQFLRNVMEHSIEEMLYEVYH